LIAGHPHEPAASSIARSNAWAITAADNLRTVNLVFAAYESARTGRTVTPALD